MQLWSILHVEFTIYRTNISTVLLVEMSGNLILIWIQGLCWRYTLLMIFNTSKFHWHVESKPYNEGHVEFQLYSEGHMEFKPYSEGHVEFKPCSEGHVEFSHPLL